LPPLHRHIHRASTPGAPGCPGAPSGRRHHPSSLVPSSWFHTTSTAFSARRLAGLLHPAAGPGVRRVSRNPLPRSRAQGPKVLRWSRGEAGLVPRDASTLRRVPPVRSRTVSPRPDPSLPLGLRRVVALPAPRCRSAEVVRSDSAPRLRGVALRTGPLRPTPFRAPGSLVPSMGLCPLRGPTSSAASLLAERPKPIPGGSPPDAPRRTAERRPSRRWRITAVEPRTSLPCGQQAAAGVCPEGSFAPPKRCRPPWGSRR